LASSSYSSPVFFSVACDSGPKGCGGDYVHQNLAVNFGFFELRTFPGLQSKVQVGSFCPFTAKVDSKSTKINQIILTSSPP